MLFIYNLPVMVNKDFRIPVYCRMLSKFAE